MIKDYYCDLCKCCEYLYDCYSRDVAEKISSDEVDDMYLHPSRCNDFYPLRKGQEVRYVNGRMADGKLFRQYDGM